MVPKIYRNQRFAYPDENEGKQSGVLVLLYEKEGQVHLPLIQRPEYEKGAHSGQVSFPGGKLEPQDANLTETALREAHEEVGVLPQTVTVIGSLSKLYIQPSGFWVLPTVGYVSAPPSFVPDQHEVAEVLTTTLEHLNHPDTIKEVEPRSDMPKFPYFDVDGRVVWGATAMMLAELMHLYQEIR
ncbi:MAG TPA: coenzyme A pyrophosphatase [Cytophagales bacterium]|nr:coenzyme A pyrophosphatase [Cytophagales bacterium]HAP61930.1 coenzyme A pyrophosphatase [Cytophagales bacterium]